MGLCLRWASRREGERERGREGAEEGGGGGVASLQQPPLKGAVLLFFLELELASIIKGRLARDWNPT